MRDWRNTGPLFINESVCLISAGYVEPPRRRHDDPAFKPTGTSKHTTRQQMATDAEILTAVLGLFR